MNAKRLSISNIVLMLVVILIFPFLPMLVSAHWDWWQAWVYALLFILAFFVSRLLAARRHPDILRERAQSMQNKETITWDKVLAPLVAFGSVLISLIAGLDKRFNWSPSLNPSLHVLGLGIMLTGYALASYALIENRFFSGTVRIQSERGHQVVSSGPYSWVRHPGYTGSLLGYIAIPLLLNSLWSIIPSIIFSTILIIRTYLEDRFLQKELPGYAEYAQHVRQRLMPGVW